MASKQVAVLLLAPKLLVQGVFWWDKKWQLYLRCHCHILLQVKDTIPATIYCSGCHTLKCQEDRNIDQISTKYRMLNFANTGSTWYLLDPRRLEVCTAKTATRSGIGKSVFCCPRNDVNLHEDSAWNSGQGGVQAETHPKQFLTSRLSISELLLMQFTSARAISDNTCHGCSAQRLSAATTMQLQQKLSQ